MRLFISIPLPKPAKRKLAKIKHDFPKLPAKWVEEENLHVTLVFIGEVKEAEAAEVAKAADAATLGQRPVKLKTERLILFPNSQRPRVLAVELAGETEKLAEFSKKIKKGLRGRQILRQAQDKKPFRPHATLARIKRLKSGERKALKDRVEDYDLAKMEFEIDRIELVESQLTPNGPIYKTIKAVYLCKTC